jgi:hypothetical protein
MSLAENITMRSDTYNVSIRVPPEFAWLSLSDVTNWVLFSPFADSIVKIDEDHFEVFSPQGIVQLETQFDRSRLLLDHVVTLTGDVRVFIPYRVVPNHLGSELIMTNVQSPHDSLEAYMVQVEWMHGELRGACKFVEAQYESKRAGQS